MILRPRVQKVVADLWGNRIRSLLVVASIAVGLFAMGVMATIYLVTLDDMQRGYAALNPAHITLNGSLFELGLVERISKLEGVRQAEGSRRVNTRLEASPGHWISFEIQAFKSPGNKQINLVNLESGAWPPGDGEIVIDRYKLPETNAKLGDMVTVELPSGKTRQLKLVGIIQDQTIGSVDSAGGFFNAPAQGYINQDTLEALEQPLPKRFDTLSITTFGDGTDKAHLEAVTAVVRDELEKNNVQIFNTALRSSLEHPNLNLVQAVLAVLAVIGLLVVFLSGFLITNTLQSLLNQQVQQIGILKSVGARRLQIAGIYLLLNLLYGLFAFVIAMPLSLQVAFWIVDFLTVQMNNSFYGFRIVSEVVVLEAVIAVLMPQIAALLPVWQGTQISVQEALSGIRQEHARRGGQRQQSWLGRLSGNLRRASLLVVISLRNTFRRKGRLALTLVTLTLGGAVFIATFNVRISLMMYIDQIVQYFLADVNITLTRPYRIEEIDELIRQTPGVEYVEGWAFARTEIIRADGSVGESVALLAPPVNSPLVEPILIDGRWIIAGDRNAIALSELFRETFPYLQVGDTIRLKVNDDETDWVIVGFYQLAGKVSGYAAYVSYDYLTELTNQLGRSASYRVVSTGENLTRSEQEALGRAIEAHLELSGIEVADVTTGESLSETASDGFDVLTAFLLFLALLTALVGSIGLTGTMSLNVMERTREIGVLRAIGASDGVLLRLVLLEGAVIGLLSWILASLASFPISEIMADTISQAIFGGPANFGFTLNGFLIWLAAVSALSVAASVMPARNATRLTIREVLSYE
jgi:putative ABC transport system permease protein